ncbi:Eco29kI family restriction endonuclease [Microbacterium esteraromaticum]|uniref:Eco29kI family restriction endonuclease n=1 Tax=Microbacterium esteraromaticum TaxID=57043 RepID=UPI001CD7CDCE|nr:Eco29kI family restriction endonuclease [Microbacterium esteraromaticum]MCA1306362.1 Eco29kI family restriction endonuclease [Microbacterium esteraromaticum]
MENLAHSIVTRMTETDPVPLDDVPRFTGAGVYAIYYRGSLPVYNLLSLAYGDDFSVPIYVGKAVPKGGRRGLEVLAHTSTRALADRIRQHANSIRAADNLDIADFTVRWLVVEDIWIPLGESALIREHRPVWNALVDGFGNHDPGSGRINGVRSRWDTLHPGRSWAVKFPARSETAADIEQDVTEYLRSRL